ncbi:MAG: hypothetical protein ABFS56_26800 [Pseudomonadota bacterium]
MKAFINTLLGQFEGELTLRLRVDLPVAPHCDLFEKMTNRQMTNFKEKLETLLNVLDYAEVAFDTDEACKKLQKQFGDDFPVPER